MHFDMTETLDGKKLAGEKSANKKKSASSPSHAPAANASPSTTGSSLPSSSSPPVSKNPTSPDAMDDQSACDKTCELDRKKKEDDDKRQRAVSAAVEVKQMSEVIDATQFSALVRRRHQGSDAGACNAFAFPKSANSRGLNAEIRSTVRDFDAGKKRALPMISTNDSIDRQT
jgi:hypothetical protein